MSNKLKTIIAEQVAGASQRTFSQLESALHNEVMDYLAQRFAVAITRAHEDPGTETLLLDLWADLRGDWVQHPPTPKGDPDDSDGGYFA